MRCEVRGSGRPLVYLHPAGGVRWTPVLEKLAETHAVHPTEAGLDSHRALAHAVGDYIEQTFGKPCDVMGSSFGGAVALWLAAERPRCVDHLVLASPAGMQTNDPGQLFGNLERIEATTLILHGTEDRVVGADSMRLLKSRLRRAFLVYVWDAGHDIELDQPERVASLVESFLERSEAFVVPYE